MLNIKLETDELDRRLGGGLPENALILIEGEEGAGKSILSQRITYGLLKNGYEVTYVSTELTTRSFIKQLHSFNYRVLPYMLKMKLLFIPVFPIISKSIKGNLLKKLMNAKQLYQKKVLIVDCLSNLVDQISDKEAQDFVNFMKKSASLGKTIILTADPEDTPQNLLNLLRNMSDGYLRLEKKVLGNQIKRYVYLERWGGVPHRVSEIFSFRVEPGIGFLLDISVIT